ncbi:protein of unknown function [Brevefilum fermentans]|jgi:hypothetical protein|uniref:Uncharacterized protein n=1 Tax=Candidatus Brevifilum fermentans TaxID=1986204 RepID=A0A1Y6K868_9CHLR|nr:protein of unknown function [Brevefilum fermentans]
MNSTGFFATDPQSFGNDQPNEPSVYSCRMAHMGKTRMRRSDASLEAFDPFFAEM